MSDPNNKTTTEELDRTYVERGWFIDRSDGGEERRERKGQINQEKGR